MRYLTKALGLTFIIFHTACKNSREEDKIYAVCSCFADSAYIDVFSEINHSYAFLSIKDPIKSDTILYDSFLLRLNSSLIDSMYRRHINRYSKNGAIMKMFHRATHIKDTIFIIKAYWSKYSMPISVSETKVFLYARDTSFNMYRDTFMIYTRNRKFICFKDDYIKLNDIAIKKTKYVYP